jgi:hypothetical protein
LSLRGLKYGEEWRPVWDFLADRHGFPGPLGRDEAVEDVATKLEANQSMVPTRVAPTVFELIGDAHQIGLRQDHVARLASIVAADDQHHVKLLEHASNHLKWDTSEFHEWEHVIAADPTRLAAFPEVKRVQGLAPVSLGQWTRQLAKDGLSSMPPMPDAPACSSTGVDGGTGDAGSAGLKCDYLDHLKVTLNGREQELGSLLRYNTDLAAELHRRDRVHTYGSFYIGDMLN